VVVALVVAGRGGVDWGHAGCRHAHRGRGDYSSSRVVAVPSAGLGGVGGVGAEDEGAEEEGEGVLDVHGAGESEELSVYLVVKLSKVSRCGCLGTSVCCLGYKGV